MTEEIKDVNYDEMSPEEVANYADDKVDALIELLIKKGVIKEEEFREEYEKLFEEAEESDNEE